MTWWNVHQTLPLNLSFGSLFDANNKNVNKNCRAEEKMKQKMIAI